MGSKSGIAGAVAFLLVGCCLALGGGPAVAEFCTDNCESGWICGQDPEDCDCPPAESCQCYPEWGNCGCDDRSECQQDEWCGGVLEDCNCSVWCDCPQYCINASGETPPCWEDGHGSCSSHGCQGSKCSQKCTDSVCSVSNQLPCPLPLARGKCAIFRACRAEDTSCTLEGAGHCYGGCCRDCYVEDPNWDQCGCFFPGCTIDEQEPNHCDFSCQC